MDHTKNNGIAGRLTALRAAMKENGVSWYLITSTDPHASEYVCAHFQYSAFISGCTSDNVRILISDEKAWLWTDSRYYISAAKELSGTEYILMKEGLPGVLSVPQFLKENCVPADGCASVLAFDGRCVDAGRGLIYRKTAEQCGLSVNGSLDLISPLWEDRPALPSHPVRIMNADLCGSTAAEKIADIRADMKAAGAKLLLLARLDDIMWLTNLRGGDVDMNPVALSYAALTEDALHLFIQPSEITDPVRKHAAENGIVLHPYEDNEDSIFRFIEKEGHVPVMLDSSAVSDALFSCAREYAPKLIRRMNPTTVRKAKKTAAEITSIRRYYLQDSVAVCKFIYRIKKWAADPDAAPMTELDAAALLDGLRAEIPGFQGLSFATIPAYGANAAMAHYAPVPGEESTLQREGFLLVDSGGQYEGATTDVTRTIALGPLSDEMKRDFTLVAAGNLRLLTAVFKAGTNGSQLDVLAREPLWVNGIDFGHGTGHGIGFVLSVHEGPQRIAPFRPGSGSDLPMESGMLTSDEPGIYRENEYGIRTESIVLTVPYAENEFGSFLTFECLTFAPIDLAAIDPDYMDSGDIARLNEYHAQVYEKIAPYLEEEERVWLADATRPL